MSYKLIKNDIQDGRLPREVVFPGRMENDDSMNSTIIHSLLCSKSATVISNICTGQVKILHRDHHSNNDFKMKQNHQIISLKWTQEDEDLEIDTFDWRCRYQS